MWCSPSRFDGDAGGARDATPTRPPRRCVLREVFGFEYDESAGRWSKSVGGRLRQSRTAPATCARTTQAVRAVDSARTRRSPNSHDRRSEGDMEGLLSMLAQGATWTAPAAGKATAARRPVVADRWPRRSSASSGSATLPDVGSRQRCTNRRTGGGRLQRRHLEGVFLVEVIDGKSHALLRHAKPRKAGRYTIRGPSAARRRKPQVEVGHIAQRLSQQGTAPGISRA